MPAPSRVITEFLLAWRIPLLVLGVVLAAATYPASRGLVFDRSIENMFAPGDPLLAPYEKLKRTFGGNEVVLAVYVDEQLLSVDGQGIRRLAALSRELKAVPGVRDVISLDQPLGERIADPANPLAATAAGLARRLHPRRRRQDGGRRLHVGPRVGNRRAATAGDRRFAADHRHVGPAG